ncbi:MAG: hypothetical protein P8Y78_08680 [Acidihalobacter sp.]
MNQDTTDNTLGDAPGARGYFRRALAALDMRGENPALLSSINAESFNWIRIIFGIALLYDAWTSLTWTHKLEVSHVLGMPIGDPVLHLMVIILAFVKLAIAISIIADRGVIPMSWTGIAYAFFVWILFQHGGDFGKDGTDPGVALPYVVMFLYLIATERLRKDPDTSRNEMLTLARNGFGLLWGYDALMKFHPYFLNHFMGYLSDAQSATAGTWIGGYEHIWVVVTQAFGPHLVALTVAVVEAAIAISLLSGRGLRVMGPIGFLLSFAIWSTAETWGGPYSFAVSSAPASLFGTASIYMLAFVFVMILYNPLELFSGKTKAVSQGSQ